MTMSPSDQASLRPEPRLSREPGTDLGARMLSGVRRVAANPVVAVLVPATILLLAFLVRILRLGDANVWWDEALAVWAVRKNILETTLWTAGDVHPPLYFWTLWGWVRLVGETEFAMRMLSVCWGVLTVAAVYALGARVSGRLTGSLAALLTSLARFHVWWSQEMRMYVLAGLLCVLSLYFFLRWLRHWQDDPAPAGHRRVLLLGYVLVSTGALYTIFLTGAILLVENSVVLVKLFLPGKGKRGFLAEWVVAQVLIAVPVAAWLWLSWGRMQSWSVTEPIGPALFTQIYATLLTTGVSTDIGRVLGYVVAPFVVLGAGAVLYLRGGCRRERGGLLAALTLLLSWSLPALAIYLATLPRSLFYTPKVEARYFLPFAAPFWVLLAWAVTIIGRRWRVIGVVCLAGLLVLWVGFLPGHYEDRILRDELQSMVRAILSQAEPGDVVVLDSGSRYPIFDYYYGRVPYEGDRPGVVEMRPKGETLTMSDAGALLNSQAGRIWLAEVDVNLSDPERLARTWLDERYPLVLSHGYGHNALFLYDETNAAPALLPEYVPATSLSVAIADGVLGGYEQPVDEFAPGDQVHVALYWDAAPSQATRVTLRDAAGRLIMAAMTSAATPGVALRQQVDFGLAEGTPAGEYAVCLGEAERPLGSLSVVRTSPVFGPGPDVKVDAAFADDIVLEGFTLRSPGGSALKTAKAGDEIILDLFWRADETVSADLIAFAHVLGQAYNPTTLGPVWGQHDSRPSYGGCPTLVWRTGDQILDRHIIILDEAAPAGEYGVEVGLYDAGTGNRLIVVGPQGTETADHVVLSTTLRVRD